MKIPIAIAGSLLSVLGVAAYNKYVKSQEAKRIEAEEKDAEEFRKLKKEVRTSTKHRIAGYRVEEQIGQLNADSFTDMEKAERALLEAAKNAGANAVINVTFRRYRGGYIAYSGDAVIVQRNT